MGLRRLYLQMLAQTLADLVDVVVDHESSSLVEARLLQVHDDDFALQRQWPALLTAERQLPNRVDLQRRACEQSSAGDPSREARRVPLTETDNQVRVEHVFPRRVQL